MTLFTSGISEFSKGLVIIMTHKEYFDKNPYIKDAYLFISSIIKYITKKNSNPRHTNFL